MVIPYSLNTTTVVIPVASENASVAFHYLRELMSDIAHCSVAGTVIAGMAV
jgi:hypothetical protein